MPIGPLHCSTLNNTDQTTTALITAIQEAIKIAVPPTLSTQHAIAGFQECKDALNEQERIRRQLQYTKVI